MSKLTYEDKINMYSDKKNGMSIMQISNKYKVRETTVKYIYRLIEIHGYGILRTTKNKYYSPNQKWYTDVTEFNLRGEKIYLSPILD